jgi:hypothetical protein
MFIAKIAQANSEAQRANAPTRQRANAPTFRSAIFLKTDLKISFKCQCLLARQNAYRRR